MYKKYFLYNKSKYNNLLCYTPAVVQKGCCEGLGLISCPQGLLLCRCVCCCDHQTVASIDPADWDGWAPGNYPGSVCWDHYSTLEEV